MGCMTLLSGLGGGMGGFHSLSQSTLVRQLGTPSRWMGLIVSGVCLLVLSFGAMLLSWVPKVVVGGMLVYLALTFLVEWIYRAWFKLRWLDYGLVLVIGVAIATWGLLQGFILGIISTAVIFVVDYSQLNIVYSSKTGQTAQSNVQRTLGQAATLQRVGDHIQILELQGQLFFGTAHTLLMLIQQRLEQPTPLSFLLLDLQRVTGLDSSAAYSLMQLKQIAQKQAITLVLTNLSGPVQQQLQRMGVIANSAAEAQSVYQIFATQTQGLAWCEAQLLQQNATRRGRYLPLLLRLKKDLPNPDWASELMALMVLIPLDAGTYLLHQGEPYEGLYFVETGQLIAIKAEIQQLSPECRKSEPVPSNEPTSAVQPIQTFGSGTLIGARGIYHHEPWSQSVVAETSSRVFFLSLEQFEQLKATHPDLAYALYQLMGQLLL